MPTAHASAAAATRRVAASHTTSGHRKNFAASVTPTHAELGSGTIAEPPRERGGKPEQSVTLPVWIAESTGGHRRTSP